MGIDADDQALINHANDTDMKLRSSIFSLAMLRYSLMLDKKDPNRDEIQGKASAALVEFADVVLQKTALVGATLS